MYIYTYVQHTHIKRIHSERAHIYQRIIRGEQWQMSGGGGAVGLACIV